ncbi:MAG: hypothetical protein KAS16_02280 [Thermoplasmata archaeon]|nr:hypothetical protein [Thermoplasmata archaeon]
MSYCQNCGLIIDRYDCPMCGYLNYKAKKPTEKQDEVQATCADHPDPGQEYPECFLERPRPKSHYFITGAVGIFILGIASMLLGIIPLFNLINDGEIFRFESSWLFLLYMIATFIFVLGCIISVVGFFGFFRHFRSWTGLAVFIYGMIAPILLLLFSLISINESHSSYYYSGYYRYYSIGMELYAGHLAVGALVIMMGISFIMVRKRLDANVSLVAGILFIISGSMLISFLGMIGVGWIMLAVACFVGGSVFIISNGNGNVQAKCVPHTYRR